MNLTGYNDSFSRSLPLFNHSAILLYTINDFFKPGPANVLQSALPFYELAIICIAFVVWIVVFLYFWKMVYFLVDDPYATPYGTAPPYEWRNLESASDRILTYIYDFMDEI